MPTRQSPNRSVERVLDILDCFLSREELMLMEISQRTKLPMSTTSRLVQTLESKGFLMRDGDSRLFRLGGKIGDLAEAYTGERFDRLRCAAAGPMEALGEKYNEAVRLFVRDGGYKLCIEAVECTREIRQIVKIGERHDLARGAAGKVMLAYMSDSVRKGILGDAEMEVQLDKVRANGYALSIGEREEGLVGIAAPIFVDTRGSLVSVLSLSGPSNRFLNEQITDKIQDTVGTAAEISRKLGADPEIYRDIELDSKEKE